MFSILSSAASLLPHRFVTVRRGSPAARSGQIRPGDRLEAVEGRSVVTLPHRELAHILRRAGNTLRLTIIPRPSTCDSVASPAIAPLYCICLIIIIQLNGFIQFLSKYFKSKYLSSLLCQHDARYYSVDLDRGPTGFGFSLRGGSEYNMGLYVLGLMEGGPASRSHKMQLVEINGDSTAGMTHSQAVEQIRRGGHRIHLVLKRGNGYVEPLHFPVTLSLEYGEFFLGVLSLSFLLEIIPNKKNLNLLLLFLCWICPSSTSPPFLVHLISLLLTCPHHIFPLHSACLCFPSLLSFTLLSFLSSSKHFCPFCSTSSFVSLFFPLSLSQWSSPVCLYV
uniref:PDZ domain-containing protein n=1 Tax=Myripristis murdjan TaxID=586833 RepID=A0A668ALR3_9TELE